MKIKYIFFDVGYTLVNEDAVWKQRCIEQSETEEAKRLGLMPETIFAEIENATLRRMPQYRTVVKKYGLSEVAPYRHELESIYDDAVPVLQTLSDNYTLGILANQTDGIRERLEAWGILRYFRLIISSWDYQILKPDRKLFEIALEKAGCVPQEALMVGDRLDNDILPAKALGMRTAWIRNGFCGLQSPASDAEKPDFEIHSLTELTALLNEPYS